MKYYIISLGDAATLFILCFMGDLNKKSFIKMSGERSQIIEKID
jgi:hypothetical protein